MNILSPRAPTSPDRAPKMMNKVGVIASQNIFGASLCPVLKTVITGCMGSVMVPAGYWIRSGGNSYVTFIKFKISDSGNSLPQTLSFHELRTMGSIQEWTFLPNKSVYANNQTSEIVVKILIGPHK